MLSAAHLEPGEAREQVKPTALASLGLSAVAAERLAARAALRDGAYREVAARLPANARIRRRRRGRLHFAALLVAHSWNIGFTPVVGGADALKYGRLSRVDQTLLRMETYRQANSALIDAQASIPLARVRAAAWSPPSTACALSCRCHRCTPGRTRSTSAPPPAVAGAGPGRRG